MKFFTFVATFAASAAFASASPAPSDNLPDLGHLHEMFEKALEQVEAAEQAKADVEVEKRQPGGATCTFLGEEACWGSCFVQTGCGGYCASNSVCTCLSC